MVTIGRRIRAWREFRGWSRAELAARIGITGPSINQWEDGDTNPTAANLEKVSRVCCADMPTFWGRLPRSKRAA